MMAFIVQPRGRGQGRDREDATVEESWELRERIEMMERWGLRPKEMSDEEEEFA